MQKNPKLPKISKLDKSGISYQLWFFKLRAKMPIFGYFGQRSTNFPMFQWNIACTLFRRCWFQIWHCLSKVSSPNTQIWAFWVKKYQLSNLLAKFCMYLIWKCADFKSPLVFKNFEPKSPNMSILSQKVSTF